MTVIPCLQDTELTRKIEEFAEVLKTEAHKLGAHGMSEQEFFESGLFRGAVERIRGQFSATMRDKRDFVQRVLDYMQDSSYIASWESDGDSNRHDYTITLPGGRIAVVELKGCLDGNNTTIFERPNHAQEFLLWSVCSNPNADPRHNVWSGVHTRLSAEIISNQKQVDGLIVWDWLCGTDTRPCPKLAGGASRLTTIGPYRVPPPCIYLFPRTIPSVRNNPNPEPHGIQDVGFLSALQACFLGRDEELNYVRFAVGNQGQDVIRTTTITRGETTQRTSRATRIRRG